MTKRDRIVRLARLPDEAPALMAFVHGLQLYEFDFEPNRRTDDEVAREYFDVLMKWVAEKDGRVLVAEGAGAALLGWAVTLIGEEEIFVRETDRKYGLVAELFVDEAARGEGVGRALIEAAEKDFRARGFKLMMIGVLDGNTRAKHAYQSWGFAPTSMRLRKRI